MKLQINKKPLTGNNFFSLFIKGSQYPFIFYKPVEIFCADDLWFFVKLLEDTEILVVEENQSIYDIVFDVILYEYNKDARVIRDLKIFKFDLPLLHFKKLSQP